MPSVVAWATFGGPSNVSVIELLLTDAALATLNRVRPVKLAEVPVKGSASLARLTLATATV